MMEQTGQAVAKIAARVLGLSDEAIANLAKTDPGAIRSLAASALTQAPARKKFLGLF